MNIHELVAKTEEDIRDNKAREATLRATIQRMLDRAESEGRMSMTVAEDAKSEAILRDIESLKAARKRLNSNLAEARRVEAEEDENDRRSRMPGKTLVRNADGTHEYREWRVGEPVSRNGVELYGAPVQSDVSAWRSSDGEVASVSRDQAFASHPVMQREAAKFAERDRIIVGQHGDFASQIRAMTTSGASAIVPTIWSGQIIDKARNAAVVMQAGATVVPMPAKVYQIGRLTGDPAPAFKAEGSAVTPGDMTYDYIQLTATSLTALVVVSMEFLQDAPAADQSIMDALGKAMALEIDKAALFGQLGATGTNDEGSAYGLASPYPKGLLKNLVDYNSGSQIVGSFPTNGTAQTAATPWNEMLAVVYKPLRSNEKAGAIVSNVALKQQYDGMYDTMYNPIRMPDVIAARPWLQTNAIPSFTRGTMTSRATDVFCGDWSQLLIGQRLGLEIRVLTERYAELGQVGLLAYWRGDVQLARPTAFAAYRGLQGAA
jgi:HK97 family phage major capsid protein